MVDARRLLELVPHYFVMLLLVIVAVGAFQVVVPDVHLVVEFVVVLLVVFLYPFAVRRVGYAPEAWE